MIIKKDTHAPFRIPRILINRQRLVAKISFTRSCVYDIGVVDQADINKLFGIGYFPSHHTNSVRFGWRYVAELDAMEIMAYWYFNKQRKWNHICFISLEREYQYVFNIIEGLHALSVYQGVDLVGAFTIPDNIKPKSYGYLLRPYFGGNQKAPHDIEISLEWM